MLCSLVGPRGRRCAGEFTCAGGGVGLCFLLLFPPPANCPPLLNAPLGAWTQGVIASGCCADGYRLSLFPSPLQGTPQLPLAGTGSHTLSLSSSLTRPCTEMSNQMSHNLDCCMPGAGAWGGRGRRQRSSWFASSQEGVPHPRWPLKPPCFLLVQGPSLP